MRDFLDTVHITACSGKGGAGSASFRREKYIPKGGPDGGDGGDGGNVVVRVSEHERTLRALRRKKLYRAEDGSPGVARKRHGKAGDNVVLNVPVGTVVRDANIGEVVAQLFSPTDSITLLVGGKGGKGNVHFKSSVRQAPTYAQKGLEGVCRDFIFELDLYADVSFIGMPNVGKSTLLKALTNANPKIGNYPFTTLIPNIGTMRVGYTDVILADIPGILEGAADGYGLGLRFLRHVRRSRVLAYVVDGSIETAEDMARRYGALYNELTKYADGGGPRDECTNDEDVHIDCLSATERKQSRFMKKPFFVIINKMDISPYEHDYSSCARAFVCAVRSKSGCPSLADEAREIQTRDVVCVSAYARRGMDDIHNIISSRVSRQSD